MTKLATATKIVEAAIAAGETKNVILDKIVAELKVTRSNAFVYFTKATKATGVKVEKAPKAEKKVAKVNPVTELSPAKAKAKIAEINNVIADLKTKARASTPEQRATAFWQQLAG